MLQYVLECIGFQLLFLIIYDVFLKKETFFQWNRVYLIGTYILSLVLPWIKIEALKTSVLKPVIVYDDYLWTPTNNLEIVGIPTETPTFEIPWLAIFIYGGMSIALLVFGYKWFQIQGLRKNAEVIKLPAFSKVIVKNSEIAFSFFKSIFLGDKIVAHEHESIIQHELVHIRQGHTYDLLFFELLRIVNWFNPLVYVYQNRIAEVHEFIADAQVAKTHKKEHYQQLLTQVFQTAHISFINPFFKSSLIKKRIVMLQKAKSKKIFQLKYLLLVPMVLGMLVYTAMANGSDFNKAEGIQANDDDAALIKKVQAEIDQEVFEFGSVTDAYFNSVTLKNFIRNEGIPTKQDYFKVQIFARLYFDSRNELFGDKENNDKTKTIPNMFPFPSTERYQEFVNSKKAFQIIDQNLKVSISAYSNEVVLLNSPEEYPEEYTRVKVNDLKDLTGDEIRNFNRISDNISKNNKVESIVITDGAYAVHVYQKEFIRIEQYENTGISEGTIVRNKGTIMFGVADVQNLTAEESIKRKALIDEVLAENGYHTLVITDGKLKTIVTHNSLTTASVEVAEVQETIDIPFSVVDEVPIFPGCENETDKRACFQEKMYQHIVDNFTYPKEAQEKGIQGKVYVNFVIGTDGVIQKLRMRGPDELLEKEALRIISLIPKMRPGKQKGEEVAVAYSIPISFKLNTDPIGSKLTPTTEHMDAKVSKMVINYNELRTERERLLKSATESNPVIKALDEQLIRLALKIKEEQELVKNNPGQALISFKAADKKPVFPGCEDALDKDECFDTKMREHIRLNFKYPPEAQKKGIQGKVYVLFHIETDGNISNIKMRGPDPILEQEAARIISLLPKIKSAEFRGKKVSVPYSMPISFVLNESPSDGTNTKETTDFMYVEASKSSENGKLYMSGKVFDKNSGLPGVNITIKDTNLGAVTDYDGNFTIAVKEGQVLLFQYLKIPNAILTVTEKDSYKVSSPKD